MKKEEFVKHIKVNGYDVDIGLDDAGQCYFYEYKDKRGNIQEGSCGTYNSNYIEYTFADLDPIYRELIRHELDDDLDEFQRQYLDHYNQVIDDLYGRTRCIKKLFDNDSWTVWLKHSDQSDDLIVTHFIDCCYDSELRINLKDYTVKCG